MGFIISTDTSANLPTTYIKENDLLLIPFSYIVDDEVKQCLDLDSFDGDAYYKLIKGKTARTSMINVEQFIDNWTPILEKGIDVLHISMSSGISGAYNASVSAAEYLNEKELGGKVVTIDTYAASLGEGLQVMKACELKKEGKSLHEIEEYVLKLRHFMNQVFTVDDLLHLKRGGRLSGGIALIGTVLHIKPILMGNEIGKIVSVDKVRGRKASLKALADDYAKKVYDTKNLVGIAHCGCREDAEEVVSLIKAVHPEQKVLVVDYEPVTGTHVGPGAVALFYFRKGENDLKANED